MTGQNIESCAGSVSLGFLSTDQLYEILLMVWLQLESSKQFRDGTASWVLFVYDRNFEVGGESQPYKQKCERTCLVCTKNTCHCQGGPIAGRARGQKQARQYVHCHIVPPCLEPLQRQPAACGQYVSVSPVASSPNKACKLLRTAIVHSRWYGVGTWPGVPKSVGLCSGARVAI